MAVETFVVPAVIDKSVVLNLPAQTPGARVGAVHDFYMRAKHFADRFFSESDVVRLLGIEDFNHESRVVRWRAVKGASGSIAGRARAGWFSFRENFAVLVMSGSEVALMRIAR